ncbi:U5 snRNP complex subunit AAR2 KNAG_0C03540 [Huiozyma naganishii CBS 8797]|uniref:A1 cistron-splicing factor AAR2 n=1 Tax=Huiozyma naganishii (strain ATCC MYA-139 / BCRC 22969 / CBS 8797 / KCTC 17520 / NBRC 10181 / NCYC 3082 / Yp74L-3) TaxID=1071383 RepID=J7RIX3_HUIN7|nr:hypothetical protein KNAG_0C03540 [Kazachstania naganishii CBS 8797]CCK69458.1 hypothetical protein KNAG_0C03540 [Kazachstania naganishii CBS 8797]
MSRIVIPQISHDTVIGIDQFSFSVKKGHPFCGIVNIPAGTHVIHFQNDGEGSSLRYGYWFRDGDYCFTYDDDDTLVMSEELDTAKFESNVAQFGKVAGGVIEYPKIDEEAKWYSLSKFILWDQISQFAPPSKYHNIIPVDSSFTTLEEHDIVSKTLDHSQDREGGNLATTFQYTPIRFKSRDAIRPGHEMTDFRDRTFYLNDVILPRYYRNKMQLYFSELQFSFLNGILFGNYGSSLQWHSLVELVCSSTKLPRENDGIIIQQVDEILACQMDTFPEEYFDVLLNKEMWSDILLGNSTRQGPHLPLTREAVNKKIPRLLDGSDGSVDSDTADVDTNTQLEYYDSETGNDGEYLPPIDSDSDGAVVVESLTYKLLRR